MGCLRLWIIIFIYYIIYCKSEELNLENIKIWGPGLNPENIVMPARYFFIESGADYNSIKSSLPIFQITINGKNIHKIDCRIWLNILDRKDGSFIVRYKLYETCYKLRIEILYKKEHVLRSLKFAKPIYADECNCNNANDIDTWLNNFQCKETYMQIEKDLIPFTKVNLTELRPKILAQYDRPSSYSLCNYVILDNKIYRKCYGKYVGFNMFMDSILLSLTRKMKLPDVDFFVNLGDWPLAPRNKKAYPIFSWCGSDDTYDIVMPTYEITESTLENMGRVMLDILSVQGNIRHVWDEKMPRAFWRGRDSNRRRLDLIDISRKHPDLFNVSITNFFFYTNETDKYGPKVEHVSFFHFYDYKYLLNMDGTVAAYRFPYLLAGDSLIFKQDSKYYEWFYKSLKPGVHYLQVNEDLSNLVEQIKWAVNNDEQAKKIALEGQKFAREFLMPQEIFCYYAILLKKWSERLISPVKIQDEMELVPQPELKHPCGCGDAVFKDEL